MLKNNYREALTEVDEILKYLPEEYILKLPQSLQDFIKENKSEEYIFNIDSDILFENQTLKDETKSFIAILLLKYWNKENREELMKQYNQNSRDYQKELQEKYSVDIFGKNNSQVEEKTETVEKSMIKYEDDKIIIKFFKNIVNFIKNIFFKKGKN